MFTNDFKIIDYKRTVFIWRKKYVWISKLSKQKW